MMALEDDVFWELTGLSIGRVTVHDTKKMITLTNKDEFWASASAAPLKSKRIRTCFFVEVIWLILTFIWHHKKRKLNTAVSRSNENVITIQDKSRLMFYKKATTELTLQTTTVIFFL